MADYFEERGINTQEENRHEIDQNNIMRLLADFSLFEEIGVTNQLAPPASKTSIDRLLEHKADENEGQCQVCLKDYVKNETIKKMPCKHKFHAVCLMAWLAKTNSCPLCRFELPTDNPYYEEYRKEKIRAKERDTDIANLHNSMFM